jgi:hypothetical protein
MMTRFAPWFLLVLPVFLFNPLARGHDRGILKGLKTQVGSISFAPGGKILAGVGGGGGEVIIWDLEKGKEIIRLKAEGHGAFVLFSPDGKTLAVTGMGLSGKYHPARLYDTATWKLRHELDFNDSTRWIAISPDSKIVAFSCSSGVVGLCQTNTGKIIDVFPPGVEHVTALAFSRDGKILATAGLKEVILWDLKAKKALAKLKGHKSPMQIVFSPDGKTLVGVGYEPDRSAILWDPLTGKETGKIPLEAMRWGKDAAFSPDGKTLAFVGTGSPDVFLWDFSAGRRLGILNPKNPDDLGILLEKVIFSPNGKYLATGGSNGTVPLWNLPKHAEWKKKDRLERIQKLVVLLDDGNFQSLWETWRELQDFGEEARPFVLNAIASSALEKKPVQNDAARLLLLRMSYKENKQLAAEVFARTAPRGIDFLVDQLVLTKDKAKETDWALLFRMAEKSATSAQNLGLGEFRIPDYVKFPLLKGGQIETSFLHQKRILAESISTQNQVAQSAILTSGPVHVNGQLYKSIVFSNGDVKIGTNVDDSIVVCNGNVEIVGGVRKSLILARGKVKYIGFIGDSVFEQKVEVPLGLLQFFNPAQVGVEVSAANGKLCVAKVEKGKPFAKAGFRKGDEILAIDKAQVRSPEEFRNLLRRRIIEGRANFSVRRNGKTLDISVDLSKID